MQCEECGAEIPRARREALRGVRLCVGCQSERDKQTRPFSGYNRRGSKDSQLR
jgi:RNA polymerase-binding transcription factor DksA